MTPETPDRLDLLFRSLAGEPLPALSPRFGDEVRRAIRIRQREAAPLPTPWASFNDWLGLFLHPRPLAAALACAVALGALSGFASSEPRPFPKAAQALALNVFRADAPGMPFTLVEGGR